MVPDLAPRSALRPVVGMARSSVRWLVVRLAQPPASSPRRRGRSLSPITAHHRHHHRRRAPRSLRLAASPGMRCMPGFAAEFVVYRQFSARLSAPAGDCTPPREGVRQTLWGSRPHRLQRSKTSVVAMHSHYCGRCLIFGARPAHCGHAKFLGPDRTRSPRPGNRQ